MKKNMKRAIRLLKDPSGSLPKVKKKVKKIAHKIEDQFLKRGVRPFYLKNTEPSGDVKLSMVVPTYNVERYIDKLLLSLMRQTSGLKNVEIIIVDDGSTDNSGKIAQKWQRAYPNTIKYVYQQNMGLSGARNTGLKHATGQWISFPDPDDFVTSDYLKHVIDEIQVTRSKPLLMIACNLIPFREAINKPTDTHPLRYRFENDRTILPASNLRKFIHLSSASAWFNLDYVRKSGFVFDTRIKPSFEDAHWVNRLILLFPETEVVFLKAPTYFHVKRADDSSLTGGANLKKTRYLDEMRYAYVDLIAEAKRIRGYVPRFIQRLILYHIFGQFIFLIDRPDRLDFLSEAEKDEYFHLMKLTFDGIDVETINTCDIQGMYEEHKVGFLALFKNESRPVTRTYLSNIDTNKKLLQFSYYSKSSEAIVSVSINETDVKPLYPSCRQTTYMGASFYYEHRFWISVENENDNIVVHVDGQQNSPVSVYGKINYTAVTFLEIKKQTMRSAPKVLPKWVRNIRNDASKQPAKNQFSDCWLFMDRDDKADDNAEHLYRYIHNNHPEIKAYFILRKSSPDWLRLENEGFSLLDFNSENHFLAILNAKILASSHIDHFVFWPISRKFIEDKVKYKFVFLQHGVTKDDISHWINPLKIDLLITATNDEHKSLTSTRNNYLISENQIALTGFARHDSLMRQPQQKTSIVIMPTWRKFLVGQTIGDGAKREKSNTLINSEYFQRWKSVLTSSTLSDIAKARNLDIIFCPHPNMAPYAADFSSNTKIKVVNPLDITSLQPMFASAALMITDYSSVAFEVAYLNKPIVYYHFDADQVFSGGHAYQRGYFDYKTHGFGPVETEEQQLLAKVSEALDGMENPEYRKRRIDTFKYRDKECSARIYDAICELVQS